MSGRKFIIGGFVCVSLICAICTISWYKNDIKKDNVRAVTPITQEDTSNQSKEIEKRNVAYKENKGIHPVQIKSYNFEETKILPISAVVALSSVSANAKKVIETLMTNSDIYYVNNENGKILIIKDANNDEDRSARHDIEIITISADGKSIQKETEFPQKMSNEDSKNDIWDYKILEGNIVLPASHKFVNNDGKIKYIEYWNYNQNNPVRYKVTDAEGKVISIRKSSGREGGNWSDEHIFYDKNGNTALNISIAYEDNNIARFMYYNPQSPETSAVIISEYVDSLKVKETLYTTDFKLKNTYIAEYTNGKCSRIKLFNSENKETNLFLVE